MSGGEISSENEVTISLSTMSGDIAVKCVVLNEIVEGIDFLIGNDTIDLLGGVFIKNGTANFNKSLVANQKMCCTVSMVNDTAIEIDEDDFKAVFNQGKWVAEWKWSSKPPDDCKFIKNYAVKPHMQDAFNEKINEWIEKGWLKQYDGEVKSVIPLMAVEQVLKKKVRPVLDYRRLNEYTSSYTGDSDVCEEKIRKWRRIGNNCKILDLKDAYLQIHIAEKFWPYQVVNFQGKTYCLTRLGFGLNSAPRIMTHILRKVLSIRQEIMEATDNYIDDILVNETIISADEVRQHLEQYGLVSKPSEE